MKRLPLLKTFYFKIYSAGSHKFSSCLDSFPTAIFWVVFLLEHGQLLSIWWILWTAGCCLSSWWVSGSVILMMVNSGQKVKVNTLQSGLVSSSSLNLCNRWPWRVVKVIEISHLGENCFIHFMYISGQNIELCISYPQTTIKAIKQNQPKCFFRSWRVKLTSTGIVW